MAGNTRTKGLAAKASKLNADERQNLMFSSIDGFADQLEEIKSALTDLATNSKQANNNNTETLRQLSKVTDRVIVLEAELKAVKTHMTALQQKIIDLEAYGRRSNLVFHGVSESDPENCEDKIKWILKEKMAIIDAADIRFERVHRLGAKRTNAKKPRPVIVRFNWYQDRAKVWSEKRKLKGSNYFVSEDFPQEVLQKQKTLLPVASKARSLGMKAHVRGDTLLVDGKSYTIDTLSSLPPNLNPALIATPLIGDDKQAFWGGSSPCSNFHLAKFCVNGVQFPSSEHFYHYSKAVFLGDEDAKQRILSSKTPYDSHQIGKELNKKLDYPTWRADHGIKAMFTACHAKFSQNNNLKSFLLSTGDRTLIEASPFDDFWGVKIPLSDVDKLKDETKWHGRNELGKVLHKVRNALKPT